MSLVPSNNTTGLYALVASKFQEWFEEFFAILLGWFRRQEEVVERVYEVAEKVGGVLMRVVEGPARVARGYFVWYLVFYVLVTPTGWKEKFFSLVGILVIYNYF